MKKSARLVAGGVALASALALSACSAGSTADSAGTADDAALTPAAIAAQEIVERVSQPVAEFVAPGPAVDATTLAGSTVYYVPFTFSVPMFLNVHASIEEAFSNLDVKVEICDGKGNPADVASCLDQAINAKAAGVISGSIPYEVATTAFDAVVDAGIPLLYTQVAPQGPGEPNKVGYLTPNNVELTSWNTNWIIADSNASADVLVVKNMDTPATQLWIDEGAVDVFASECPDCNVEVITYNTAQLDKLASDVTAKLTTNPNISYIHAGLDVAVQTVVQGLQAAGRSSADVSVVSADGNLAVLQMLSSGNFLSAEVGFNQSALAWYATDQMVRMMAGEDSVQALEFPYRRIFTEEGAAELTLTPEAEKTGEWYGDTNYKKGFLALWGAK